MHNPADRPLPPSVQADLDASLAVAAGLNAALDIVYGPVTVNVDPRAFIDIETERCIARHSEVAPLTICFERTMTHAELAARLRLAGLVLYATVDGGVGARTIEQHRKVIELNAKRGRVAHYQGVEAEARADVGARYRPFTCKNDHPNCSTKVYGNCDREQPR